MINLSPKQKIPIEKIPNELNPKQKTGLKRNPIDKYYTKSSIATLCINQFKSHIDISQNDLIIEPSAGNGSFINPIKTLTCNYRFFDIKPEHVDITKQDYLELNHTLLTNSYKKIHIIGNPPFGRQSSLAIKFIKKSCEYADSISFILPKSFKKYSMQKHFSNRFHLISEIDLETNSFLINNIECDVPCIFQIWKREDNPREIVLKIEPKNFKFVRASESPHISVRRVGVNAGTISKDISNKSIQSHYFISFTNAICKTNSKSIDENIEKLKNIKFEEGNTVGPKSISKQELIIKFNQFNLI